MVTRLHRYVRPPTAYSYSTNGSFVPSVSLKPYFISPGLFRRDRTVDLITLPTVAGQRLALRISHSLTATATRMIPGNMAATSVMNTAPADMPGLPSTSA